MLYATLPNGATESAEHTVVDAEEQPDGFLPLVYTDRPDSTARRGYQWGARYRRIDGERVEQFWVEEEVPVVPRTFSKFKLKLAIASEGYLDEFTAMLSSFEVVPGYMGDEAFRDAVTLDEDHPKFKEAVRLAKDNLGLTDEEVERILAASVAD